MDASILPPKAIFFDLDETLITNTLPIQQLFAEMFYQFSEQLGDENRTLFFSSLRENARDLWATMFTQLKSPEQQFVDCFATTISALDNFSDANTQSLASAMFERFVDLSKSNVVFQAGAKKTLRTLREKGFITGIITNGVEQIQLAKIHALNLYDQVDHVIVSAQARAHKPHADVFKLALDRSSVAPDRAWQVGDHAINDVAGAIRVGMSGVFYNPDRINPEDAFAEIEETPTHIIHHLSEVLELSGA